LVIDFNGILCVQAVAVAPHVNVNFISSQPSLKTNGRMDGWLGFNGILSTQVAAISCLKKFKVC